MAWCMVYWKTITVVLALTVDRLDFSKLAFSDTFQGISHY